MNGIFKIGASTYTTLANALASGRSGSISVTANGSDIAGAIGSGLLTTNANRISKITNSNGADISLTVDQLKVNKAVLLKLSSATVAVADDAADIGSNITSLDAVYSKIKSIESTGAATSDETDNVSITYNDYKASRNITGLTRLINSFDYDSTAAVDTGEKVNVTGFSGNSAALSALINDAKVSSITVNDTIANLTQNASLIMGSSKIVTGAGLGVSVTDTLKNINTDSAKALIGSVLASKKNTDAGSIKVSLSASEMTAGTLAQLTATTGAAGVNMTVFRSKLDLIISGNAADISKNAQALTNAVGSTIGSFISAIKVNDGTSAKPTTINLSANQYNDIKTQIAVASNADRYKYKLTDVTVAQATAIQADDLVLSYNMKDTAANLTTAAGDIATALTDKVKSLAITDTLAADVTTATTGISDQYDLLSLVQKAKVSVAVKDTVANITAGTTLTEIGAKAFIKSIEATSSDVTNLTSTAGTNGINIVNNKAITKITVTDSFADVATYVNSNTKPTKVTFA